MFYIVLELLTLYAYVNKIGSFTALRFLLQKMRPTYTRDTYDTYSSLLKNTYLMC